MKKCSSKYLNLHALESITKSNPSSNSVILLTNFGYIIGELDLDGSEDNHNVSNLISRIKSSILESGEVDIFGDGSSVCIKNAVVKYANNSTLNFNELTVHCEDIVGFAPINKSEILSQIPQC